MILSFAAYRQSLDDSLVVGAAITADLHRYPGPSSRALVGAVHDAAPDDGPAAPPAGTVAEACVDVGAALAAEPWADRVPATLVAAPTLAAGTVGPHRRDRGARPGAGPPGLATLLAASGGRPVAVTIEWTVDGAVPLTVHLDDRALDIGPRADPSFVSAA